MWKSPLSANVLEFLYLIPAFLYVSTIVLIHIHYVYIKDMQKTQNIIKT